MPDPRLDLAERTSADTEGDVQRVLGKLEKSSNSIKIIRLLANSPNVFRPFVLMANALTVEAKLPAKEREVVILHLGARRRVAYEWAEHVPMSQGAGVTDEQREALSDGTLDNLSTFTDPEKLALTATDEIVGSRTLSEQTWQRACELWGRDGALDLIFTVAWWGGFVPTVIESFGLESPT